ncbi:SoxR reducing system RseC family protein [Alteromonas sp. ASW11-130]|uniref:SoxR reducing system RseC family protein n=1 Tax=Alteromonas sp. ASW11-130 TaxID=3015775 RepID=UPI002241C4AE|nr:SoxR reducing system RseC family protein [Alteromonas sp. ASW11-130]MCW8092900.1 SoxR reducing system RseC family protein [Alteromonas sp. ASW11-130]
MIVERATVICVQGDTVTVEAAIKTTCNACQVNQDCGTGVVSRALAPRTQQLTFKTPVPTKIGDVVKVGVPEAGILSASAWLYLAPLIVFLISALVFNNMLPSLGLYSELWVVLGSGIVTFLGGVLTSRYLKSKDTAKFQPVILSATDPSVKLRK